MRYAILLMAWTLPGCSNAILEFEVAGLANTRDFSGGNYHLVLQFRPNTDPGSAFPDRWDESRSADIRIVGGVPMGGDPMMDEPVYVDIEDSGDHETAPLRVKIRLCMETLCRAPADENSPELWIEIERAFYSGRYTAAHFDLMGVPVLPPERHDITKCEIHGCSSDRRSNYCRADGSHLCE